MKKVVYISILSFCVIVLVCTALAALKEKQDDKTVGMHTWLVLDESGAAPGSISQTESKISFVFEYNNDLYLGDTETKQTEKISDDHSPDYDKEALISKLQQSVPYEGDVYNTPLTWISTPLINKSGTHVLFLSNRRGFASNTPHTDIWVKDLLTSKEYMAVEDAVAVAWFSENYIVFYRGEEGGVYNVWTSGMYQTEVSDGYFAANEHVAVATLVNGFRLFDFATHESVDIPIKHTVTVYNGTMSEDGRKVAQPFRIKPATFMWQLPMFRARLSIESSNRQSNTVDWWSFRKTGN